MTRRATDVVIPFAGTAHELTDLARRLHGLILRPADTLLIVDNNRRPSTGPSAGPRVIHAGERPTPAYARGALRGRGEWIAFLDADVIPEPDLLDRLFDPPPREQTALLGGGIQTSRCGVVGPWGATRACAV